MSTEPQTRQIKARYLEPGMTVLLTASTPHRYAHDTVVVSFDDVLGELSFDVEHGVTIVERTPSMSCPRNCGVDMREHNSSDLVNGGCDTDRTTYRVTFHDVEVDPLTMAGNPDAPRRAEQLAAAIRCHLADSGYTAEVAVHPASGTATVRDEDDNYDLGEVTITGPGMGPQPEPDLRQRLAAELRRIADDLVAQQLPLGRVMSASLSPGVLDSRADLDRWATYLGSPVRIDSNGIPFAEAQIRLGKKYGASLTVGAQTRQEHPSEVERLRAENAALLARLGVEKAEQGSDTGRCPVCKHEAEHLHDSGCLARKDGVRCGCKHIAGGAR